MKGRTLEEINHIFQDGVSVREFSKYSIPTIGVDEEGKGKQITLHQSLI
jgi:hypothetical protein